MSNKSSMEKTKWITRTALCTALVLLAQVVGKYLLPAGLPIYGPFTLNQLVTGSLVNLILILSAANIGLVSGITVGIISSLLATLLGITAIPFLTPAIALGNAIIAAIAWFFLGKFTAKGMHAAGVILGAGAKCAFLWVSVPFILSLLPNIKEQQTAAMTIMFSWPQFVTAVIGGIIALVVYNPLKKAVSR